MRLIDADSLKYRKTSHSGETSYYIYDFDIKQSPTVDAIPVEKVARMFALYTEDYPCNFATGYYKSQKDEFCGFNSVCSYESNYDCWLHALKEGWLDE